MFPDFYLKIFCFQKQNVRMPRKTYVPLSHRTLYYFLPENSKVVYILPLKYLHSILTVTIIDCTTLKIVFHLNL